MGKFSFSKKSARQGGKEASRQPRILSKQEVGMPSEAKEGLFDFEKAPKKFAFLRGWTKSEPPVRPPAGRPDWVDHVSAEANRRIDRQQPSVLPGCETEHVLQDQWQTRERANNFYNKQVLDFLAPKMQEFIKRQEFLFIASADRNGECDCTSKFGTPGFIRVLSDKFLVYPEYRGNGVFANTGNMLENPHIALLMIDFTHDTVGLHVNGKVRIVTNGELLQFREKLPADVIEEIHQEGKKCPERWMMVEVEEAYIQCAKHIPLMKKLDKKIDWGTDNVAVKGGDYFEVMKIPLYRRIGGDKALEACSEIFYRKVLQDEEVKHFFDDVDRESRRLKQKSFLSMAFGGPYQYREPDLGDSRKRLAADRNLTDRHFDRVCEIFRETVSEMHIPPDQIEEMMANLAGRRDAVLNR